MIFGESVRSKVRTVENRRKKENLLEGDSDRKREKGEGIKYCEVETE